MSKKKLLVSDPIKWVRVVRQQMEPMFSRLATVPFRHYPAAGLWLTKMLAEKREQFWAQVEGMLGQLTLTKGSAVVD